MKQHDTETTINPNDQASYSNERERHDYAISLNKLGTAHYSSGHYKDAIMSHEQALKIYGELYGENFTLYDIAVTLDNLGTVHNALGNYKESIEYHYRALNIYTELYDNGYADFDMIVINFRIKHFGSYKEAKKYHFKKFYELAVEFAGASDTYPYLNHELLNPKEYYGFDDMKDVDMYEENSTHHVYNDLRNAITYYMRASHMEAGLERSYERRFCEDQFSEQPCYTE